MKTSDKILLIAVLTAMGLFGWVQLSLYAKYRKGEIVTERMWHSEEFTTIRLPAPKFIVVEGHMRTRVIPSDTFSIDLRKENDNEIEGAYMMKVPGTKYARVTMENDNDRALTYQVNGDTLFIRGRDPRPWPESVDMPIPLVTLVNIHCRPLPIEVRQGEIVLPGTPVAGLDYNLSVHSGRVILGELDNPSNGREFFSKISVESYQSKITLSPATVINDLQLQLHDRSTVEDRGSYLGKLTLDVDSTSRAILSGPNLDKLKGKP